MSDGLLRASTELAALVPEIWSKAFYSTLLEQLPFNEVIDRSYEGDIRALGDTVNITQFPQFDEASELAEDAAADASAITATNLQLVINKQVVKDFIITNVAQVQSIDAMEQLRMLAMHSIMKKMQSIIVGLVSPSSSSPDHTLAYDSSTTLALADILEAKELLDGSDVPDDGRRCMIMDAPQANDIFNITGFVSRDFIPAGSPLSSGQFPTPILGFLPKMTTAATANVTYLFHPSFMTMAVQKAPAVDVYDLGVDGKRGLRVNMTSLFGVKQLSSIRVVTLS